MFINAFTLMIRKLTKSQPVGSTIAVLHYVVAFSWKKKFICRYSIVYIKYYFSWGFLLQSFFAQYIRWNMSVMLGMAISFCLSVSMSYFFYHGKNSHLCVSVDISLFFTTFWNTNVKCLDIFHKRKRSDDKTPTTLERVHGWNVSGEKEFTEDYVSKESNE